MLIEITSTTLAGLPALRAAGDAGRPPLLFLHGAFVTHEPWRGWMTRLAGRGWAGVAPVRRGRLGAGPARARGLRFGDYLQDTLEAIDALGETPIVVGHSLGGLLAQKVAEAGRCRAMVLLSPAPAAMLTAQAVALPGFLPMMPRILSGQPVLPTAGGCARIALNRMPVGERPGCHASLVHESGAVYREMIFGAIRVDPAKVTCPTYVLGGAEDHVVSQRLLRFTAERYRADLKILDGHAHWLLEEPGWEAIVDDVADWLERVLRPVLPKETGPLSRPGADLPAAPVPTAID
jgi:pimeloyl-ACP methyl ester carboxylesterase